MQLTWVGRGLTAMGRSLIGFTATAMALIAGTAAQAQGFPPPYPDAVAARFPAPALRLEAPVFAPQREHFTTDDELAAQLSAVQRSAAPSARIELLSPGTSQQGTAIRALRFSREPVVSGAGSARPTVLLIGQQHGDEPAGAEALLLLARELASTVTGAADLAAVLEHVNVIVLPRANPDGAELARRVTSNGIDINRDHLLLRTPEAQALAALVQRYRPNVVVDAHEHTVVGRYLEKFNAVQRNDMLLQYAMVANLPEALGRASETWFRQPLLQALAEAGLSSEWYYTNPVTPGDLRLSMGGVQPDTSRNVQGLRHAISFLLESRGVGIGRLHLERRVHSQLVAMRSILRSAAAHADELIALQRAADAEVSAAACQGQVVVVAATTPTRRELLMLDPVTGADKAVPVQWDSALQLRALATRARPCGYWLAASATAAAQRLRALGLQVEVLSAPAELHAEAWVERTRLEMNRPDVRGTAADGEARMLRVEVDLLARKLSAPAGSFYVPLNQPLAHIAVAVFEPDTQNSWFANRLLPGLEVAMRVLQRP